ncbi:hypothetical protein KGM_203460 [Danaus plexippus plexippus]|uniref:Lipocalin n=1 Tax=Danaus plexippus plexippus TaxID=278856 RepID=A0A212F5U8_DANPL|nr:hypothetical protein KGM_203460 [Danaus plexippus plexippus]
MAMLYEILIIWSCVTIGAHSLRSFETKVNNDTNIESKQFRKQYGDMMPRKETFMPMQMKKKKDAPETFYEPYMEKGDWVFYRSKFSLRRYARTIQDTVDVLNLLDLDRDLDSIERIAVQRDERKENYGQVCAMRYDRSAKENVFRTFDSLCHVEFENCRSDTETWFPRYKGSCVKLVRSQPMKNLDLAKFAATYEGRIKLFK